MVADRNGSVSRSKGAIIGIAVGCGVLVIALVGAAVYALVQRRRAQKATEELGGPFGTQSLSKNPKSFHVHLAMLEPDE
jgi:uncharacterized protein YqgC (DUF456 family)